MKRILTILLALAMVISLFSLVACGEEPAETSKTNAATTAATEQKANTSADKAATSTTAKGEAGTTVAGTASTTKGGASTVASTASTSSTVSGGSDDDDGLDGLSKHPDFMDVNFGGHEFKFAVHKTDDWDCFEIDAEATGDDDMVTEGILQRNSVVESLYNCTITAIESDSVTSLISEDVSIGAYNYDFYREQYQDTNMPVYAYNIASLDIDLTHSWFDQDFIRNFGATVDGVKKLYSISGSFDLISNDAVWCMFYNKKVYETLAASGKITTDLYDTIRNGEWTIDTMLTMMEAAATDANGDSKFSYADGDVFGFATIDNGYAAYGFYFGIGGMGTVYDATKDQPVSASNETMDVAAISAGIDSAIKIYSSEYSVRLGGTNTQAAMTNGQALFISECLAVAKRVTDENAYFSIVPFPKATASQDNYRHMVCNRAYGMEVSAAIRDPAMIAQFLEVFSFHSQKILYPAYLNYYKTQCFCDDEAGEMLDLVLSTKAYDLDYFASGGIVGTAAGFILNGGNKFSRALAGKVAITDQILATRMENMKNHN